jgi:asparagine synthase (glutamine-hydrolysing)
MCGICGVVDLNSSECVNSEIIRHMCQSLTHRGPDDEGYYEKDGISLGMRRLSIIDIVQGHQPISNEDKTIWIVFNGEIYNFQELKLNLEKTGHIFSTSSDTEVIVHLYEELGIGCVNHLNGMFAFAIWDQKKRQIFIARDHLGIKPLFYCYQKNRLIFGSEIKAILEFPHIEQEIDLKALDQFLSIEYILAPRTIYTGIKKLPPGHFLIFNDRGLYIKRYWEVNAAPIHLDRSSYIEQARSLLSDAIKKQMVSDVPLGAFLSGGIDSSSVVAYMSQASVEPIQTFSVGFEDTTYNELPYSREVASRFGTRHHEEILFPDIQSLLVKLVTHFDEPFGDFSIFPTYLVSTVARKYVKVALSGDGGDEVFGGYDTYLANSMDHIYKRLPGFIRSNLLPRIMDSIPPRPVKKGVINKAKRMVEGASLDPCLQHVRWMIFANQKTRENMYHPDFFNALDEWSILPVFSDYFDQAKDFSPLAQQQYVDIKTYLADDILVKVDRMSMATSLETRVPLLDYRLVEFALNIPDGLKIARGKTKIILREAVQHLLPSKVLKKPKEGFSIPLKDWLRGPLKPVMMDLIGPESIRRQGYFNHETVSKMIEDHMNQRANHSHRLWALMVFEIWRQNAFRTAGIQANYS